MKKHTTAFAVFAVGMIAALTSIGAHAKGSSGIGTVDRIVHRDDRTVVIYRSGENDWDNPDACTSSLKVILTGGGDTDLVREQLSTLIAGFTTGKAVSFGLDGCFTQNSGDTIPLVTLVSIYNDVEVID